MEDNKVNIESDDSSHNSLEDILNSSLSEISTDIYEETDVEVDGKTDADADDDDEEEYVNADVSTTAICDSIVELDSEIEATEANEAMESVNTNETKTNYVPMNLKHLPFICKMSIGWLFGIEFMAIALCGYYAYLSQSLPLWLGFMILSMKYMFGLWYTIFTSVVVLCVELVIHRRKVLQFIELLNANYKQIKQSIKLNKELHMTIDGEKDFDIGNVNSNMERIVEYVGTCESKYREIVNTATNTKIYKLFDMYYDTTISFIHMENSRKILLNVDNMLGQLYDFLKKILSNVPFIGEHVQKFFKDLDNVDMVHTQHKYDEEDGDGISTKVFEDDDSNDIISNDSDPNNNSPISIKTPKVESELDQLLKAMPAPSNQREKEMKKQLELLANMKMPDIPNMKNMKNMPNMPNMPMPNMLMPNMSNMQDMKNMDIEELNGQMNKMVEMMGTLGTLAGKLEGISKTNINTTQKKK